MELIDMQYVGSESRLRVDNMDSVSVYASALEDTTWDGGELTVQVSIDGDTWFDAKSVAGVVPEVLDSDGGITSIYTGDVAEVRVTVTTAAGSSVPVQVRWP